MIMKIGDEDDSNKIYVSSEILEKLISKCSKIMTKQVLINSAPAQVK